MIYLGLESPGMRRQITHRVSELVCVSIVSVADVLRAVSVVAIVLSAVISVARLPRPKFGMAIHILVN